MYFLTIDNVIHLNRQFMLDTNEHFAILFYGVLEGCVKKTQMKLFGTEFYSDIYDKAAALMHCIIVRTPFENGNKRTGIAAALVFLEMNGVIVSVDVFESKDFTSRIANLQVEIPEIVQWLRVHTQQPRYIT